MKNLWIQSFYIGDHQSKKIILMSKEEQYMFFRLKIFKLL